MKVLYTEWLVSTQKYQANFWWALIRAVAISDIEELTRKTGNFKQFSIFLNMLESAITKSSDSVALDLLTYTDLESLRKTKLSSSSSNTSGRGFTPGRNRTPSPHAKRYLILTYSVEFDR